MPVIKKNETFIDFVANQMGNMNALFDVALINNSSITEDYSGGEMLQLIPISSFRVFAPVVVKPYVPETVGKVLKKHQNNTDFVCQHFGTMESIFDLALLNGISITENPVPGNVFKTRVDEERVVDFYLASGLDIASEELPVFDNMPRGGIGYMKIRNMDLPQSNDFIVS